MFVLGLGRVDSPLAEMIGKHVHMALRFQFFVGLGAVPEQCEQLSSKAVDPGFVCAVGGLWARILHAAL